MNKEDKKIFEEYCQGYKYYPLILPAQKELIVIGDLHGDWNLTIRVLKLSGVIDDNNKWIGKKIYVIQLGDQLDNCRPYKTKCDDETNDNYSTYSGTSPEDIKVLKFFTELNEQANKDGGAVISLLGNHEIMNVLGSMNYVSYNDLKKLSKEDRIKSFKQGNKYAKLLACSRLPTIIIGSFIFVHGGFINKLLEKIKIKNRDDLYKISYFMKKWLLGLIDKHYVVDIVTSKSYSLFWDRILGSIPPNLSNKDNKCIKYLDPVLKLFQVDKMIIGHTPQSFINHIGINNTCDDKLWRIDFGGSYGFNKFDIEYEKTGNVTKLRNAQVLKILDDKDIFILSENQAKD